MSINNSRIIQFDVLRVLAAFAVVLLHTSAQRFYDCYPSEEWNVRNFYDSLVRGAVPVFIMISGALFLNPNKNLEIKKLFAKNVTHIITIFIIWSIMYRVYSGMDDKVMGFVGGIVHGPFHFWFLKMLLGLYISVPILRVVVKNSKLEVFLILISMVIAFLIPMLFPLWGYFSDNTRSFVENLYDEFRIKTALGYVCYFLLGCYLSHTAITVKVKKYICILGIMSVVYVYVFTYLTSKHYGEPYLFLYEYINVFTLSEALAVFVVINGIKILPKYHRFVIIASKLCLGIYIVHPLIMQIVFDLWKIDSATLNALFFIPIYAFLIFFISSLLAFVLVRIPIINKILI